MIVYVFGRLDGEGHDTHYVLDVEPRDASQGSLPAKLVGACPTIEAALAIGRAYREPPLDEVLRQGIAAARRPPRRLSVVP